VARADKSRGADPLVYIGCISQDACSSLGGTCASSCASGCQCIAPMDYNTNYPLVLIGTSAVADGNVYQGSGPPPYNVQYFLSWMLSGLCSDSNAIYSGSFNHGVFKWVDKQQVTLTWPLMRHAKLVVNVTGGEAYVEVDDASGNVLYKSQSKVTPNSSPLVVDLDVAPYQQLTISFWGDPWPSGAGYGVGTYAFYPHTCGTVPLIAVVQDSSGNTVARQVVYASLPNSPNGDHNGTIQLNPGDYVLSAYLQPCSDCMDLAAQSRLRVVAQTSTVTVNIVGVYVNGNKVTSGSVNVNSNSYTLTVVLKNLLPLPQTATLVINSAQQQVQLDAYGTNQVQVTRQIQQSGIDLLDIYAVDSNGLKTDDVTLTVSASPSCNYQCVETLSCTGTCTFYGCGGPGTCCCNTNQAPSIRIANYEQYISMTAGQGYTTTITATNSGNGACQPSGCYLEAWIPGVMNTTTLDLGAMYPGSSKTVQLQIPAIKTPGTYTLYIDAKVGTAVTDLKTATVAVSNSAAQQVSIVSAAPSGQVLVGNQWYLTVSIYSQGQASAVVRAREENSLSYGEASVQLSQGLNTVTVPMSPFSSSGTYKVAVYAVVGTSQTQPYYVTVVVSDQSSLSISNVSLNVSPCSSQLSLTEVSVVVTVLNSGGPPTTPPTLETYLDGQLADKRSISVGDHTSATAVINLNVTCSSSHKLDLKLFYNGVQVSSVSRQITPQVTDGGQKGACPPSTYCTDQNSCTNSGGRCVSSAPCGCCCDLSGGTTPVNQTCSLNVSAAQVGGNINISVSGAPSGCNVEIVVKTPDGQTQTIAGTTATVPVSSAGIYTIQAIGTGGCNCFGQTSVSVEAVPQQTPSPQQAPQQGADIYSMVEQMIPLILLLAIVKAIK